MAIVHDYQCRIPSLHRHCEERSDEAIQRTKAPYVPLDCFASLAMTTPAKRAMLKEALP
jgi:hypothetical protein